MAAALNIAQQSQSSGFKEFISVIDSKGTSVSGLRNILCDYMQVPQEKTCQMAKLTMSLNKAALLTFQAWHHRTPGIVGVLFGKTKGDKSKRWTCVTIIIDESFDDIIKIAPERPGMEGLRPVGVCLAGAAADTGSGIAWCRKLLDDHLPTSTLAIASLLSF